MKKIYILVFTILSLLLLTSCKSKNIYTFILDDSFTEYVTMGTSADYAPYETLAIVDDKMTVVGIDIELGKLIAKDLGKNLKVINKDFDFLLQDLSSGSLDFVISGMEPNSDRRKEVDFSDIYYEATHGVLLRKNDVDNYKDLESLNNKSIRVGAQLGTTQQSLLEEEISNATRKIVANVNDLVMDLKNRNIDAVILETPVAETFVKRDNTLALANFTIGEGEGGSAVAVKKGDQTLLISVNNTIRRLKEDGSLEEIIFDALLNVEDFSENKPFSFLFNIEYVKILLQGLLMTIVLALLSVLFGSIIGVFVSLARISNNKTLNVISKTYVEIIRGTPLLVQVLLIYSFFKLPVITFLGIDLASFIPGVIALLINSSAYVSEIFRGGIESVDRGQSEAAISLGMSEKQVMRKIVIPQAIKTIIPSLGNEFVTMIKETSIFMYLGIAELMYAAIIVKVNTYQIKEVYIVTALLYLILTLSTSKLMSIYERKLGASDAR